MGAIMTRELLRRELETLPDPLAEQVLDFVLFMKARHEEDAFLWQQVEATQARRHAHPETVATVTADEWDALTAHEDDDR